MGRKKKDKKADLHEIKQNKPFLGELFKPPLLYVLLGVIILLGAYLRFSHLSADPPTDLSWSLSPYTDEGAIIINARDKALFGHWLMDDFFRMGISSLLSVIYFFIFKLFGTGFIQIRVLPVLSSLGTILLVFFLLKREKSVYSAVFSSFFLSIAYIYIMHNRLALEETNLLFVLLLSLFFLQLGKDKRIYFLMSGFTFILAVLFVKISGLFFLTVMFMEFVRWIWMEKEERKKKLWQSLVYFVLGLAGGLLIWLFFVLLPYKNAVILYIQSAALKSPAGKAASLGAYLRSIITLGISDKLFPRIFFIFIFSFLYVIYWVRNINDKIKSGTSMEFVSACWVILGTFFLSYPNYHPIRYQLLLVPPLCILAGFFMEKTIEAKKLKISGNFSPPSLILQFLILVIFIYGLYYSVILHILVNYQSFYGIVSSFSSDPNSWFQGVLELMQNYSALVGRSLIIALLVSGGILGFSQINKFREGLSFPKSLKYTFLILVLFLVTYSNLKQYSAWTENLTYDLPDISRDLSSLPKGSIIAGPWAATLSLENSHYAIEMQDFANKDKVIERFKPTHLIIFKDGWEDIFFKKTYPDLMSKAVLLKEYSIHTPHNRPLLLYELPEN
jgi:4-amino-4-deoxy-L-arabinose transferase-like glycosyltransferase